MVFVVIFARAASVVPMVRSRSSSVSDGSQMLEDLSDSDYELETDVEGPPLRMGPSLRIITREYTIHLTRKIRCAVDAFTAMERLGPEFRLALANMPRGLQRDRLRRRWRDLRRRVRAERLGRDSSIMRW